MILNCINMRMKTHILVVHCKSSSEEDEILEVLKRNTRKYRVKSRNWTEKGMDYVFEIVMKDAGTFAGDMEKSAIIERFSLMEYDSDDVL